MFESVGAIEAAVAAVQGTLTVGQTVGRNGRSSAIAEAAALTAFLHAASDALVAAEHLTIVGHTTATRTRDTLLALLGTWLPADFAPIPAGATMRLLSVFALGGDLVGQAATRRDVRDLLVLSGQLTRTHVELRRTASHECVAATEDLLGCISAVFQALPGVATPWQQLAHRQAIRSSDDQFRAAMKDAWSAHRLLASGGRERSLRHPRSRFVLGAAPEG